MVLIRRYILESTMGLDEINDKALTTVANKWVNQNPDVEPSEIKDVVKKFNLLSTYQRVPGFDISRDNYGLIKRVTDQTYGSVSKNQVKRSFKELKPNEYKTVFSNELASVVVPFTWEASCKLGTHTQWCTSSTSNNLSFRRYTNKGINLFIILPTHSYLGKIIVLLDGENRVVEVRNSENALMGKKWLKDKLDTYQIPSSIFHHIKISPIARKPISYEL